MFHALVCIFDTLPEEKGNGGRKKRVKDVKHMVIKGDLTLVVNTQ